MLSETKNDHKELMQKRDAEEERLRLSHKKIVDALTAKLNQAHAEHTALKDKSTDDAHNHNREKQLLQQ